MSWQSIENMAYMGYFLATKSVPVIAVGASIVFAVSPWGTVKTIQKARSTLQFPFAPFFFYFVSSVIYTLYAIATANVLMGSTALLGAVLGSYYVYVFYVHANDKTQPTRMLTYSVVFVVLLTLAVARAPNAAPLLIGVPGNVLSVATSASPLLQLRTILRLKDASSLPFGMSVMNVISGGVWMVYGFMLHDKFVVLPNLFALTMGLIQTTLIVLYPGPGATKGHGANAHAPTRATKHVEPLSPTAAALSPTAKSIAARGRTKSPGVSA